MAINAMAQTSSTIAAVLANPPTLSDEQQLFHEALNQVKKDKAHTGTLPLFFNSLITARGANDVECLIETKRGENAVWREQDGGTNLRKLEKLSASILKYKQLADSLVAINSKIASPVWGSIAFVIGIFKNLSDTRELLERVMQRLGTSMERFSEYYQPTRDVDKSLRSSLRQYYKRIVLFAWELIPQLTHTWRGSLFRAVQGSVQEAVSKFDIDIKHMIENVDWGAAASYQREAREQHGEIKNMIKNLGTQAAAVTATDPSTRVPGLPSLLSHDFTGRQQDLQAIRTILLKSPHQVSVHGIGGVGKTQILLRYADMHHPKHQLQTSYDYIFFVNASTAGSITQSVLSIVNALGLPQGDSFSDTTRNLHGWLIKKPNWLLIFDNAESLDDIEGIRPPLDTGHVLFSTRHGDIASLLINGAKPIEIFPMDKTTATDFAHAKCQRSLFEEDRDIAVAADVSSFARGLPLAIEQVIHDSFFSKRAIRNTLHLIRQKQVLLEQNNRSSLHGPNSSIAAIIEQTLVDIRSRHPPAATLFSILAYWDPSSVPMSLLRAGVRTIPAYLERPHLFARDTVTDSVQHKSNAATVPSSPSLFDYDPFKIDTWRILLRQGLRQPPPSGTRRRTIPGETGLEASVRVAFGEGTTLHELFSDVAFVNRAIQILYEAALIRYIGNDRIWMHDLYCEVAQALVERESMEAGHRAATAASTLVYLAFPNPRIRAMPNDDKICMQYRPHAIKCHHHLKTMEILNNLSIGPELSHIIASTIAIQHGVRWSCSFENNQRRAVRDRNRVDAIQYYRHAFVGYIACHIRLKSANRGSSRQVLKSVAADTEGVRARGCDLRDLTYDYHRHGQTPLYRALHTIIQLTMLIREMPDGAGKPETVSMWMFLVEWFGALFGSCHDITISARWSLSGALSSAGRIQESYAAAIDGLKVVLGWNDKKRVFKPSNIDGSCGVYYSAHAKDFCIQAGERCLELPGDYRGREAVIYFKIALKYKEWRLGKEHITCIGAMQQLAMAYEKANERVAAIYWYGRSVLCQLSVLVWEGTTYADGDPACPEVVRYSDDSWLEDTVNIYKRAHERLGPFDSSRLALHQFLNAVDSKIELWRTDREKHGCPYERAHEWRIEPYDGTLERILAAQAAVLEELERRENNEGAAAEDLVSSDSAVAIDGA